MKHRFGLRARFISFIIGLFTILFTIIVLILIRTEGSSLRQDLFSRSKAFAALATKPIGDSFQTYQDSGSFLITQQVIGFTKLDSSVVNVSVVDITGKDSYHLHPLAKPVLTYQAASFQPVYINDKNGSIQRIIYPFIDDNGSHQYAVVYDISSGEINRAVNNLEKSIIMYSLIGLALSALICYQLIKQLFLDPIKKVRDQAVIIRAGHYSEEISVDRNDEIGDLAESVRQMADRLKDDILKLKEVDQIKSEFMMIASHYLRTPLTIIEGYLEMAKSQNLSKELRGMLNTIEVNSQQLGVFAEDLLIISGIEAGQKIFNLQPVVLTDLLTTLAHDFGLKAKTKNITFTTEFASSNLRVQGSTVHLRNAITNLLDNAYKFTPDDGKIELVLKQSGDLAKITITDNGSGIAPEEINKLFTKFHRGTSTLHFDYEGSGIGLYLTKLIMTEHGGSIDVASEVGKGSTFTVTLPLIKP